MPIVKGYIKMGIISTDTLERSDTQSVEKLIIQMAKKGNTAKQKPMQPELQKISRDMAKLCCLLPRKCQGYLLARGHQGPVC